MCAWYMKGGFDEYTLLSQRLYDKYFLMPCFVGCDLRAVYNNIACPVATVTKLAHWKKNLTNSERRMVNTLKDKTKADT